MIIHGLQKLTLVDFPSYVAAILFTGACNFRCPFCHNAPLVLSPDTQEAIDEKEIFNFLRKRKGFLEGVVVTGGEPTLQPDLIDFLGKIKELGYKVKLDSNGYKPDVLKNVIESGVVDYIAMDIKNSKDKYPLTAGVKNVDISRITESIELLLDNKVDYEFRTTVVNELHNEESIREIGAWIKGAKRYYLQSFVQSENTIEKGFSSSRVETLNSYVEILKNYIDNVQVRDI